MNSPCLSFEVNWVFDYGVSWQWVLHSTRVDYGGEPSSWLQLKMTVKECWKYSRSSTCCHNLAFFFFLSLSLQSCELLTYMGWHKENTSGSVKSLFFHLTNPSVWLVARIYPYSWSCENRATFLSAAWVSCISLQISATFLLGVTDWFEFA